MKLAALAAAKTTVCELYNPETGEDVGVSITAYTTQSNEYKQAEKEISGPPKKRRMILPQKKKGRQDASPSIEVDTDDPDTTRRHMAAIVTSIDGLDDWQFSPEAVEAIFLTPDHWWMADQLYAHLNAGTGFFAMPAKARRSTSKT